MPRTIDAPDKEWLNATEAAAWLNITDRAFGHLVKEELIPPGKKIMRDEVYWHWRTLVAISILLESGYFGREKSDPTAPEPPEKPKK